MHTNFLNNLLQQLHVLLQVNADLLSKQIITIYQINQSLRFKLRSKSDYLSIIRWIFILEFQQSATIAYSELEFDINFKLLSPWFN